MHTEKAAKKLACCGQLTVTKCMGSRCMAWRWAMIDNPDYTDADRYMLSSQPSRKPMLIQDREHGYCGLAGRP